MPLLYKSFPVSEIEQAGNGLRVVGKCSDGQIDHDGDVVSPAWMAQAVNEWLKTYPAVRLQHRADAPVGKGIQAWQDADGATWVKSLIVSGKAKKMVKSGVLAAYSVGIASPVTKQSPRARRWEIIGGRLAEVSLVDSPSNARCGIEVCKSVDGVPRYVGKAWGSVPKKKKAKTKVKAVSKGVLADPARYQKWLAKQAKGSGPALDPVVAMFLASGDPQVREAAESSGLYL